jgi:hypothetical protein
MRLETMYSLFMGVGKIEKIDMLFLMFIEATHSTYFRKVYSEMGGCP